MEVGPRLSFTTAWSANAVSICRACAVEEVTRIEQSRRFLLTVSDGAAALDEEQIRKFTSMVIFEEM